MLKVNWKKLAISVLKAAFLVSAILLFSIIIAFMVELAKCYVSLWCLIRLLLFGLLCVLIIFFYKKNG